MRWLWHLTELCDAISALIDAFVAIQVRRRASGSGGPMMVAAKVLTSEDGELAHLDELVASAPKSGRASARHRLISLLLTRMIICFLAEFASYSDT
jgi:hypothetical protein